MKVVSVFNPSILSPNIGDDIILDSVYTELRELFKETFFVNIPTHELVFRNTYRTLKQSAYAFVAGTNLLSSNMFLRKQWKLTPLDLFMIKNLILMGTGWRNYEQKTNLYAQTMYKKVLHKTLYHSVRDEYTKKRLNDIGIHNVLNTACPTMWRLSPNHLKQIPVKKASTAVFTITSYRQDKEKDQILIQTLLEHYDKVYFFMQQIADFHYFNTLNIDNKKQISIINPTLKDYDIFLDQNNADYIGTRLHGGIRALQKKKRTIIIGVDNRAMEISKDTNLFVLDRESIGSLGEIIYTDIQQELSLPLENIEKWKQQFK